MTENKRFECNEGSRIIIDNETKLHYIMTLDWECSLVTKLLNRFVDENEKLKKEGMSYYLNGTLVEDIKTLLVVLAFCEFPKTNRLSTDEFSAIARLQGFLCENIIDLDKLKKECKK